MRSIFFPDSVGLWAPGKQVCLQLPDIAHGAEGFVTWSLCCTLGPAACVSVLWTHMEHTGQRFPSCQKTKSLQAAGPGDRRRTNNPLGAVLPSPPRA